MAQAVNNLTANSGDPGLIPGSGRTLEKGMATRSSILTWRMPWTEDSGRLQSKGSQRHCLTSHCWILSHPLNTASINYCSIMSTVVIFSLSGVLWKEISFSTDFFLVLPRKKEHPSEFHSAPIFLLSMTLPFNTWAKMKYYNLFSTFLAGKNKSFLSRKDCLFRTNMFLPVWFF